MMKKKVSLVLTTYNCLDNLKMTLDSIDIQDYPNIEIIIKDGGSTDGTINLIKEFSKTSTRQIKWESTPDNGIYDAMNQGYKLSTGDYILFFNDTFVKKNAVSLMVSAIESDIRVVGCHSDITYS